MGRTFRRLGALATPVMLIALASTIAHADQRQIARGKYLVAVAVPFGPREKPSAFVMTVLPPDVYNNLTLLPEAHK